MKPILFAENSTTFTTNGIGRLDAIRCIVTEQRNGVYELEMDIPVTSRHYSDLALRKIIVAAPAYNTSLQPFRIYKITKPINGKVTVLAQHISYDLSKNVAMAFSVAASSSACNSTLQGLKTNAVETCPFTFWTDVTTNAGYTQAVPASIRERLGGIEGSVLDQFGGEYEFDGFTVKLHRKRGADHGVTLRYGKNITDLSQEENIANTITGVVPFWISVDRQTTVVLPEKAVYSANASRYSHKLTVALDLSEKFQSAPTVAQLRSAAQTFVSGSGIGIPAVSVKVSFINLRDTVEYADVESLESVKLCDDVHVQFESLGIDTTAEIVETVWDVLKERYNSVSVGSLRSSLATAINDQNTQIIEAQTQASNAINTATKWLTATGGYVIALKNTDGTWESLVFASSTDLTAQTTQCLKINKNGIGFSTTGINGPYKQGWTCDGQLLIGGTYAPSIKIHDANGNIIGQWDINGINIKKGTIKGSTIELGGENNSDGSMTVYGWDTTKPVGQRKVVVGTWNKDGISVKGGTIEGATIKGSTIKGSTIRFGDESGSNYATMQWQRMPDTSLEIYELGIIANGGRNIRIASEYGGQRGSIYANAGSAGIFGSNVTSLGQAGSEVSISGKNINLYTTGDTLLNNYHIAQAGEKDFMVYTFESGGFKYLGIQKNGTVYGYVQLI